MLIDALRDGDVHGATALDIGGGIGAVQLGLLDAGARSVVSVDASCRAAAHIASRPRARQYGRMAKTKNRTKRQRTGGPAAGETPRRKKKSGLSGASLVFIGLILIAAIAIALANVFGDRPDCPPGQVWSEAHGHCH
ncbi:MAG TPA: hypothetical protein VHG09_06160 [Longimicrobiales bacterium]|nr:hypothetical protein [Longimicrobiales bacterium]